MIVFPPEQLIASHKANTACLFTLTNQAFEGFHRLVELNLQAIRLALTESEANWQDALSGKTPEEFLTRQTNLMQPAAEKALSYTRQLYDIVSSTQAEWTKVVQSQYEHHRHNTQSFVDDLAKNAPTRPEVATGMLKLAPSTANNACETVRKATDEVIEAAKRNRAGTAAAASKQDQQASAQGARATKQ